VVFHGGRDSLSVLHFEPRPAGSKEVTMLSSWRASSRTRWIVVSTGLALLYAAIGAHHARSQESVTVVGVAEDWELVVGEPDSGNAAPQLTCTISPHGHLNNLHSVLEINHKTVPFWAPGGVHLQTWVGEYNLTRKSIENHSPLSHAGEVVTWTSSMTVGGNVLTFTVDNGNSTSWGSFGNGNSLQVSYGTSLTNLNNYSPNFSVSNSGVGFASNRVQSLVLKQVRYTLSTGDVLVDNTPRVVHQSETQLEPEP
jgi:hypothetical protein